jgi:voltage-gated potassium channel
MTNTQHLDHQTTRKAHVHRILEGAAANDRLGRAIDYLIIGLIVLNIAALVAETVDEVRRDYRLGFRALEVVSVLVFTCEYLARIWSCTVVPKYAHPLRGRLRYALTPLALIDLLAILPFYLAIVGIDVLFFHTVLLFRLVRVGKLVRYSESLRVFGRIILRKKYELLTTLFMLLLMLLFSSSLMYFVENDAQPDKFSSIPAAMWWGMATLTTVGYGDIFPITTAGKLLASVISVLGIGVCALPTGILSAAFIEELNSRKQAVKNCPHCGKPIA